MTNAAGLYGQSLYDLAAEENLQDRIAEEMEGVKKIFQENPDYIRLLSEPSIAKKERQKLLDDAFGGQIEPYLLNFLKLLLDKGLLREFNGCCKKVHECYNRDHGIVEATVISAVELTGDQLQALTQKMESISGKKVLLSQKIDAQVLGGLRVEMEGKLYDGTVKGRLDDLRKKVETTVM